ncbi:MAG: cysteinyl-tRNA synthetase [Candidatus Nanopelagicaceae bacterium]|nr:cysteinyl-tRNA synthetase [Candidatus Nanopelagicaceae bacterium]
MNSWPRNNLPLVAGYEFPTLKIIDSNLGLVTLNTPSDFRIYVCGITPYDATHLGHAATYLAFDLINRYQSLSGRSVNFVENVTDIDDPLLERAKRDNSNWQNIADTQTQLFKADMSALRILPPNDLVKVTESIAIINDFIKKLDSRGYLYEISGDYYFSVGDFLSGLPVSTSDAVKIFAERGGDPYRQGKKHQLDPLVWSANAEGEPGWESSFGFGRPGWHVECTAIACKYLDKDSNDPIVHVQGGGSDLIFPHHFMSAQIVKAAYGRDFSQYFVHAAMIGLDGEKMSKSKGNLVFVSKLISAGIDPMAIRWALLQGHYQKDREWSENLLSESEIQIATVRRALAQSEVTESKELIAGIIADLSKNLDTPSALKRLLSWSEQSINAGSINQSGLVSRSIDSLLGLAL